uniref:Uncharacterized protein n=1 Tax=Aegilops tauschii subsp. strangulata TaxID=200361 RepID=A0A453DV13_AEGTS
LISQGKSGAMIHFARNLKFGYQLRLTVLYLTLGLPSSKTTSQVHLTRLECCILL